MLEDLSIKDFALIDSASVEFGSGFTVLSGETGAGKSLLIGALTFLLGGKAGVEQIRSGAHESSVSGTFYLGNAPSSLRELKDDDEPLTAFEWLSLHGIEAEDNRVLLRRVIRENGKFSRIQFIFNRYSRTARASVAYEGERTPKILGFVRRPY